MEGKWGMVTREMDQGVCYIFKRTNVTTAEGRYMAAKEVDFLRQLNSQNPHIIRLVNEGYSCGEHTLVMEDGGIDLFWVIHKRAWHPYATQREFADHAFVQLTNGVAFLHQRHIVHRDLKLENAVRDALGLVKLVDFNLSHAFQNEEERCLKDCVGTHPYTAPEVYHHEKREALQVDAYKVDAWALGVMYYTMHTSQHLFLDEKPCPPNCHGLNEMTRRQLAGCTPAASVPYLPKRMHVSPHWDLVMDSTLSLSPERRHDVATLHALFYERAVKPAFHFSLGEEGNGCQQQG